MNVVIMGCGRVGARLAISLDAEGHKITIFDIDSNSLRRLPENFSGTAFVGDGTEEDTLVRAGINDAEAFVALTQSDNRNIMAAQMAKHLFKVPRVVCRIYDPLRQELYQTLGLEAISPTTIFAQLLREKVEG